MNFFCRLTLICTLALGLMPNCYADNRANNFYRNFWMPTYHGIQLSYCTVDGKTCGLAVATRYCQMMGYHRADQHVIEHNVGLTNYIGSTATCQGWRCNGFKTIRCVAELTHKPPKGYHYRYRKFVYPRFDYYRVDWCYDGKRGCGQRAAFSFCRRMGYLQTRRYQIEKGVAATKAIGNQKLCFGKECNAFKSIICYR
ncbi:hypothetical protein BN59_03221 [Legionella massiliensis]|uniref:SRCR domain-containing protein n=1 Tax=Legionella massiliensis TaxID=1034943 RepID=A0A078L169_9GAMM|nr:hypothetical protein [Legionella massiliensis]CDZ78906.1 hypothetical protein BN59_03221 [Legionella massiliensis]CEE14644.1 hypothetical protein BN1094_03221 [Legionella massiliensis]